MSIIPRVTPLLRLNSSTIEWCIKVRVVRMWNIKSDMNPCKISEIHMILLDQEGKKIQATIPAQCVDLFSNVLYEDSVYMIAFFHVKDNLIPSMTTLNQFRLLFCSTTTVIPSHSFSIGYYSLMLFHSEKISNYRYGLSYLIDVIGVVSAVHEIPSHEKSQYTASAVKVTLTDRRGHFECILCGSYGDDFKIMMLESCSKIPILLLQFVRIISKNGIAYIETCEQITKVLLNPPIIEVERFKIDIGYGNGSIMSDNKVNYSSSRSSKLLEFNGLYPHKTIYEFINMMEDGLFVLCGKVAGLFKVNQWFYPVCHCGAFLNISFGSYRCVQCCITVFSAVSRCNLQVSIRDNSSAALLPMTYNLIEGIDCLDINGSPFVLSTDAAKALLDKQVLMIVKKIKRADELSDDVVEVLRITDDIHLIKQFYLNDNNFTPAKSIFSNTCGDLQYDLPLIGSMSADAVSVAAGKTVLAEDHFQMLVDVSAAEYQKKYKDIKLHNNVVDGEGCSSNNI
ncbi:hypothetical protein P8452_42859 [Trifolium repens]|nr:hypothetical protein P8452_42859 [Trifolium repens]